MKIHRDDYGTLYRTLHAGDELIVTDESGLIIVRFRFLACKGRNARIEAIALRLYGLKHSAKQPHEN
jgi:hypothetical protein